MMNNRHFFYIAVALGCTALFGACNKDNDFVDFGASIASYGNNGSKVYVDGGREGTHFAYWHDGDAVMINGHEYNVTLSTSQVNNQDQTSAAINDVLVNEGGYYAIYPCDKIISSSTSGYPTILLPQVQIFEKDVATNKQIIKAPMAAYSSNGGRRTLNFTNLCSLIEVYLPAEKEVAYINVTSDDNFLWGKATISGTTNPSLSLNDNVTAQDYTTSNKTVTLDCSTNGYVGSNTNGAAATGVTSAGPFYIVVPARTYSNLKVDVYVFDGTNSGRRVVKLYSAGETVASGSTSTPSTNIASNMIYTVTMPSTYEQVQPPYPGLGTGEFSVSATKKVRFSMGNLQYRNSVWRFAENELVSFLDAEDHNTVTTDRSNYWIDLFGYGTSGKGNPSYPPTTYATTGSYATSAIAGTPYDWGVNEISNGGNQPNKWRTLTLTEWQYLMGRSGPKHVGTVITKNNNEVVLGYVVAPDVSPDGTSLTFPASNYPSGLHITEAEFYSNYRSKGCIFLPVTGYYSQNYYTGNITMYIDEPGGKAGYYWASTLDNGSFWASKLVVSSTGGSVSFAGQGRRAFEGCAVRLVRDVD